MNKHSADATTAEEALAIQETLDSNMATEVAMKNTLLTPRFYTCLLYTSPSPRDEKVSRMPSSA